MWRWTVIVYAKTGLSENWVSLKKLGILYPDRAHQLSIYMRTGQILITWYKNRNRPVLKKVRTAQHCLVPAHVGCPSERYRDLYPSETGAFHTLQLRQFRNAVEWGSVLRQIDVKQAAGRCTVVAAAAAGITVFPLFSPKESTGVYSWSVLGHWNPENSCKFLWWFGGSWCEKEMRKREEDLRMKQARPK
jgi:hypothetical protein